MLHSNTPNYNLKTGHAVVDPTPNSDYTIYWKIKKIWGPNSSNTYNGYFRAFPGAIGFYRYILVWCQAKY